jgi:hypothetical protein
MIAPKLEEDWSKGVGTEGTIVGRPPQSGGGPRDNSVATTTEGGPINEIQRVRYTAGTSTAGTFRLAFNGETSRAIAYNTTAADVESVAPAEIFA